MLCGMTGLPIASSGCARHGGVRTAARRSNPAVRVAAAQRYRRSCRPKKQPHHRKIRWLAIQTEEPDQLRTRRGQCPSHRISLHFRRTSAARLQ